MNFHLYDLALVYSDPAIEVLLLFVLFTRRRAASFPIFTTCIAIGVAIDAVLLYVTHWQPHRYQITYLTLGILDQTIQLLVLYEISMHVFRPTGLWARDVRKILICISIGGITFAFLLAVLAHPSASKPMYVLIQRINLFYSILVIELCAGMLALSSTVGLPWKTHAARIAQGYGAASLIYLISHVITGTLNAAQHPYLFAARGRIGITLCLGCQVYWVIMLWRDAPAPRELPERLRNQIYTLHQQVENDLIRIRSWRSN